MNAKKMSEYTSAIGDKGELWLASRLPNGWIWQPPRKDVGKDGLVVIRDDSDLHNLEFSIQVKTTENAKISNGFVTANNVSRSSVLYWHVSTHPTLVIIIDITKNTAWYAWHFNLFDSVSDFYTKSKKTMQIKIPVENKLTDDSWSEIRSELKRCYSYLQNSTSKADSYVWIMASINIVCGSVNYLVRMSEESVPDEKMSEDEGISLLIEQHQHKNILVIANKYLNGLDPNCKLYTDTKEWVTSYEKIVRGAFISLGDIPTTVNNDFRSELLTFHPIMLASSRKQLIMMAVDLIGLLSKIHPDGSHNAA